MKITFVCFSQVEAKHLQLSVNQIDKSLADYSSLNSSSTTMNSIENDSANTTTRPLKNTRPIKANKYSPVKTNFVDEYSPTVCYNNNSSDEAYYSNLSLYSSLNNSDPSFYYEYQQKKRIRFDYDQSNLTTNESSSNFYSSTPNNNHCYGTTIGTYSNEHTYHSTPSQQYFFNGWNGTTAF